MESKRCNKCGRTLKVESFSHDRHQFDGRACYCKDCLRARSRKYTELKRSGLSPTLARFSTTDLLREIDLRFKMKK